MYTKREDQCIVVLHVEDNKDTQNFLRNYMEKYNIKVISIASFQEAIEWLEQNSNIDIDVVILDMEMGEGEQKSGIDIGTMIAKSMKIRPEFIVWSRIQDNMMFYRGAINLGIAKYLYKNKGKDSDPDVKSDLDNLLPYVIAGALRKRFQINEKKVNLIRQVIRKTANKNGAIFNFCKILWQEQLDICLPMHHSLLISLENRKQYLLTSSSFQCLEEEKDEDILQMIQVFTHTILRKKSYFLLEKLEFKNFIKRDKMINAKKKYFWDNNYVIKLVTNYNIQISLLLPNKNQDGKDNDELCCILTEYLYDPIREGMIQMLDCWTRAEASRKLMQGAISRFCLQTGQTQLSLLSQGLQNKEFERGNTIDKMQKIGKSLYCTGELLANIGNVSDEEELSLRTEELKTITDSVLQSRFISEYRKKEKVKVTGEYRENLFLSARKNNNYLYIAFSNIIRWFVERNTRLYQNNWSDVICIEKKEEEWGISLHIWDKSKRLSQNVRKLLFDPFASIASYIEQEPFEAKEKDQAREYDFNHTPLFLARVIIEIQNGGAIEDTSDSLVGTDGNRFSIYFPYFER